MKYKSKILLRTVIWILVLMIISFNADIAAASGIHDIIQFISGKIPAHFILSIEYEKLPQFDDKRMEQLNLLIRHFRLSGFLEDNKSILCAALDNDELFSLRTVYDGKNNKTILSIDPEHFYIVPEEATRVGQFADSLNLLKMNLDIYHSMESYEAFFEKLPEYFPEQSGTSKILEKYKDYGTAVKKVTIRISAEDLTSCLHRHFYKFPQEHCFPDPKSIVFSGRQDFELLLTEDGRALKIRYGGIAGFSEEDMRNVRLEWKTVRSESVDRDELSLRTPDNGGTKRNNLILDHARRIETDGKESFFWKAETDTLSDGNRARKIIQCNARTDGESIIGNCSVSIKEKNITAEDEFLFEFSDDLSAYSSGTLEIISKKDKIENEKLKVNFGFSPETSVQVTELLPDATIVSKDEYSDIRKNLTTKILNAVLRLPASDLVFLTEGIPDEVTEKIILNPETMKEPIL